MCLYCGGRCSLRARIDLCTNKFMYSSNSIMIKLCVDLASGILACIFSILIRRTLHVYLVPFLLILSSACRPTVAYQYQAFSGNLVNNRKLFLIPIIKSQIVLDIQCI